MNTFEYQGEGNEITEFVIPEGTKTIGHFAFSNCKNLKSVIIPEGVTKIEPLAFDDCPNLETVNLPKSLDSQTRYIFNLCPNLKNVIIPEHLSEMTKQWNTAVSLREQIHDWNIKEQKMNDSLKDIKEYAQYQKIKNDFYEQKNEWIKGISDLLAEDNPFINGLYQENEPDRVTLYWDKLTVTIGGEKLTILPTVLDMETSNKILSDKLIKEYYLSNYSLDEEGNLVYDTINGEGVSYKSPEEEMDIDKLIDNRYHVQICEKCLHVKEGVAFIEGARPEYIPVEMFRGDNDIKEFNIPESVTEIQSRAFAECTSLETVNLPDSITDVGEQAFFECCNLKTVMYKEQNIINFIDEYGDLTQPLEEIDKILENQSIDEASIDEYDER